MPDGKDIVQLESIFSFVAAFVDRTLGINYCHSMTHVHFIFSELRHLLNRKDMGETKMLQSLNIIQNHIRYLKALPTNKFHACWRTVLYTLKSNLHEHIIKKLVLLRMFEIAEYLPVRTLQSSHHTVVLIHITAPYNCLRKDLISC